MRDDIYISNTQKYNKKIDNHLSDVQYMIKNRQKIDSLSAHYEQHFKSTT